MFDATFGGIQVRIFLVRRTQHGKWNGLLTTDTGMDFFKAWRIYSGRWALEVVFKDCKTNLDSASAEHQLCISDCRRHIVLSAV